MRVIEHRLNQEVWGIETKYLVFGGCIVAGSVTLLAARVVTWEQVGPLLTLIVGHYFGRRNSGNSNDSNGEKS